MLMRLFGRCYKNSLRMMVVTTHSGAATTYLDEPRHPTGSITWVVTAEGGDTVSGCYVTRTDPFTRDGSREGKDTGRGPCWRRTVRRGEGSGPTTASCINHHRGIMMNNDDHRHKKFLNNSDEDNNNNKCLPFAGATAEALPPPCRYRNRMISFGIVARVNLLGRIRRQRQRRRRRRRRRRHFPRCLCRRATRHHHPGHIHHHPFLLVLFL